MDTDLHAARESAWALSRLLACYGTDANVDLRIPFAAEVDKLIAALGLKRQYTTGELAIFRIRSSHGFPNTFPKCPHPDTAEDGLDAPPNCE